MNYERQTCNKTIMSGCFDTKLVCYNCVLSTNSMYWFNRGFFIITYMVTKEVTLIMGNHLKLQQLDFPDQKYVDSRPKLKFRNAFPESNVYFWHIPNFIQLNRCKVCKKINLLIAGISNHYILFKVCHVN